MSRKDNEPLLGWKSPDELSPQGQEFHRQCEERLSQFALPDPTTGGPVKVVLTDTWKHPEIVSKIGMEFPGFRQLTGSCTGASGGDCTATLSFAQYLFSQNPTEPFVPWWLYTYGRCRLAGGDHGRGEGAAVLIWGRTAKDEGVFGIGEIDGEPDYDRRDGLALMQQVEYDWSDGSGPPSHYLQVGKKHPIGGIARMGGPDDIKAAICNAYPVHTGYPLYVGHGQVVSRPGGAYVRGRFDGRGGHATGFLGYWDHPDDGPLFLYSNQWDESTYPNDPAGGGRCCVWLPRSEVEAMFRNPSLQAYAYSQLNYFPAQPKVLDFSTI
jgi:hypothetical protein